VFISVLICTRNRAASLQETLLHFFEQRFTGGYEYELIVVDNDSTDHTRQVVADCAAQQTSVRYVLERRRGLSYARNTAISSAAGELLVFTDDDVRPNADWLDEIHSEFTRDPRLGMLGGRVLLAHHGLLAVSYQPSTERQEWVFPASGGGPIGANMAFRREVFERVGLFDVRLGAGTFFAGGEETDLFYRAMKAGYRQLYAPNVLVHHDHDRTLPEQACAMEFSYGKGLAAQLTKHALHGDGVALRRLIRLLLILPVRWRRSRDESLDAVRRRRAQVRGVVLGAMAAPFVMWTRPPDAKPRAAD
jgi:glycosyltransferase involved in cell wall biosynthesis